ncbi:hypothetical protein BLNAU_22020 [Blattamonas nauphoetae]|uniref:Uncharacterized protein n=1 Tax=Blattamonas nauphoetae TaxID=2049346 RepID=A0ABQ9WX95_9EUKA|nr:hypothetical protein BLNAU_22020 [Blattamonas nauphoetae]
MYTENIALNTCNNARSNDSPESLSTVNIIKQSLLNFRPNSELSFEDKSTIYCSLVALVKEQYRFDNDLLNRAAWLLRNLAPFGKDRESAAAKLVTDLVPSSAGSPSGFVESILVLFSSPDSKLVSTALLFLFRILSISSPAVRLLLVDSDLFTNLFVIFRPHTLLLSGNGSIADSLIRNIQDLLELSFPSTLRKLGITASADAFNHREMIFRKLVVPSSRFVTSLISKRCVLNQEFFHSTIIMLGTLLQIGPFHHATLEFILASPIVFTFISSLDRQEEWNVIPSIDLSLKGWKIQGPEVLQSGKLIVQALFSEGLEDALEQMLKYDEDTPSRGIIEEMCLSIFMLLGANNSKPPYPHPPFWA